MTTTSTKHAPAPSAGSNDLIYQLDDTPAFAPAIFAALQHVLAAFVGIITPTLIIGSVLGLGAHVPYLVSMALFVSGLGTLVQAKRIGPIGSGLLCLFGICFCAAFVEIAFSQFINKLRKVIAPVVTGTIICLMGLSLIKVGMTD